MGTKMTLSQFAALINNADEWSMRFNEIITQNGWEDLTHEDTKICRDNQTKETLEFNDDGIAVIIMDFEFKKQ